MVLVRFGTIRAYDAGTHTATLEITGYAVSKLEGVAVADNIDGAVVLDGAGCVVAFNEGYSVADACVIAVY